MKKILAIVLAALLCFSLVACGGNTDNKETTEAANAGETTESNEKVDFSDLKVGVVLLHNETVGYDENFMNAIAEACKNLGIDESQVTYKKDIPEDSACYDACVELCEDGCDLVFADSFGHEEFVIKAAKEFPNVQFFHATGTSAKLVELKNFHNAFASIYEGRFLAGVVAGMKLQELIDNGTIKADEAKIGYISAKPYAECISGYTSFYLGARYICKSATMQVTYTDSWADLALEQEAAKKLIENGCVLISEHADTDGSPMACEEAVKSGKTVFHVGYNIDFTDVAPKANLVSSKINWTPYFETIFTAVATNGEVETDYCGSIATGSIELTPYTEANLADGTAEKVEEVKALIAKGELKVFDTASFTVKEDATIKANEANFVSADNYKTDEDGHLTSYMADAITDDKFTPDTEAIVDGVFSESTFRSAPYFNVIIDGITIL